MPRNKTLLKGRGSSSSGQKKIIIRPYQKPPTLPPNYYEQTVANLMSLTCSVLDQKRSAGYGSINSSPKSSSTTTPFLMQEQLTSTKETTAIPAKLSLQNAYTAVVHLVSHQYGIQLYQDLRVSMQGACEKILPDEIAFRATRVSAEGLNWNDQTMLQLIPLLYQYYTEYLLCVKHVFLPLDRTHVWQADIQQVLPIRGSTGSIPVSGANNSKSFCPESNHSTNTDSSNATGFSPHAQQSLWQVGLSVWSDRLKKLGIEKALYQSWLQSLLHEWNPGDMSIMGDSTLVGMNTRQHLQAVWYMWQDLGWLSVLPIQQDLEDYWRKESQSWESEIPYRPVHFVSFCYDKHQHIHCWPWLPSAWLMGIVEQCLLRPHLLKAEEEGANSCLSLKKKTLPPGLLLQADNFNPLLEEAMFGSSMSSMFPENKGGEDGQRTILQLWILAGRVLNGQPAVAQAIAQFARTHGLQRVQGVGNPSKSAMLVEKKKEPLSALNPVNTIGDLLQLQDALTHLIRSLPHGIDLINLKNVWEEVVNQETKPCVAEALAKFMDQILRSNKKMDQYQQESDNWLGKIISGVFVPLHAKDVFEAFYKRDLAKRLLWNRVVSMDVEKQVCSMLKAECGAAYTSKMEGMFQDVDWSRETMMVYKQSIAGQVAVNAQVEMEVQVLTTGYWPVYPQYPNLQLPVSLVEQQEQFTSHYKMKHQGRRMNWQYALGHCIVKCSGFSRHYELVVGLCQAIVLLQFETSSEWKLPDLMKAVGLEDRDEMERILQSLALGKEGTRILRKTDQDADLTRKKKVRMNVEDNDKFTINERFESNQRRIRITNIMMKETKEEHDKTVEAVSRDRLYLIDAVLVRVMKARKTILHHSLIPQVLEQVKVPAQPADVKKRIESLIEREYMERDSKDRNRYNYLA